MNRYDPSIMDLNFENKIFIRDLWQALLHHISFSMQKSPLPNDDKVEVFVKIKPPSQDELYTASTKAQLSAKTTKAPSPSAASVRRAIPMKTSLLKDFPLSFYASDSSNAKKVFFFQNPIPKKLLDENIKSESDLENLRQTVFSSSTPFEFDRAFSMNQQ